MARQDSPRDSDDPLAEVQTATRALNDAINSLTRSVVETSTRTSQDAVAGSMRKAARSGAHKTDAQADAAQADVTDAKTKDGDQGQQADGECDVAHGERDPYGQDSDYWVVMYRKAIGRPTMDCHGTHREAVARSSSTTPSSLSAGLVSGGRFGLLWWDLMTGRSGLMPRPECHRSAWDAGRRMAAWGRKLFLYVRVDPCGGPAWHRHTDILSLGEPRLGIPA